LRAIKFLPGFLISISLLALAPVCFGEEETESAEKISEEEQKLREDIEGLLDKIEKLEDVREKALAAQEIIDKGEKAVSYLVEVYPSKSIALKGWLAQIFFKMNAAEKAKDVLFNDFKEAGLDGSPDVIRTLGKMKDERATPLILELLKEADARQKRYLYYALSVVTDYKALDELREGLTSDDRVIWLNCAKGLGNLQERALKELQEKQEAPESVKETQEKLKAIYQALREGLKKTRGNNECQRFLIELAGKSENEKFSSVLAGYLKDDAENLRITAMNSLARLKSTFYAPHIAELLNDESELVRRKVPAALARLGEQSVVPDLIEALYAEDRVLKNEALKALRKLTGKKFGMNPNLWLEWWENPEDTSVSD